MKNIEAIVKPFKLEEIEDATTGEKKTFALLIGQPQRFGKGRSRA